MSIGGISGSTISETNDCTVSLRAKGLAFIHGFFFTCT